MSVQQGATARVESRELDPLPAVHSEVDHHELAGLKLFQDVDTDLIEPVVRGCQVRHLQPDEVLISRAEPTRHLYLILSGSLAVILQGDEASPFATLGAGDTAGEMSLIDKDTPSAEVRALEPTRCLVVDEELLWMLVEMSHAICTNLLFTLIGRIRSGNDIIRENRQELKRFKFHATVDANTGLFNRYWLERMLPRQMKRARASETSLTLLMVDIDHFKQFNDCYGHVMGDHALRAVASGFRDQLRATDLSTRYGGEEFIIILPETDLETGVLVAERLRGFVESTVIENGDEELPGVTISIGVASLPAEGDMEAFIQRCDEALYRAKHRGRNCVSR